MAKSKKDTPSFLDVMLREAEKESGQLGVYEPGKLADRYWGIPIPALAFQYLIGGCNILPYGHMIELAGSPGTFKSSLATEMIRWVTEPPVGGLGVYISAERDQSPTLMTSILGSIANSKHVQYVASVETVEGWQSECMSRVKLAAEHDPDSRYPMALVVDSVSGRLLNEEQEKFEKEGAAAARGFPVAAKSITGFCKGYHPALMRENTPIMPIIFIGINHLKIKPDSQYESKYTTGGVGKDFQATLRLWTRSKSSKPSFLTAQTISEAMPKRMRDVGMTLTGEGARYSIDVTCQKSSLGWTGRSIDVDIYAGYEGGTPVMWFDWDGAFADLIAASCGRGTIGTKKISVIEKARSYVLTVDDTKVLANVSACEVGEYIQADAELLADIRNYFHIMSYREHTENKTHQEVFEGVT